MTIGTVTRLFTWSGPTIFLYTSYICAISNGVAGVLVMAAPAAISSSWFPVSERATAISVSQTAYVAGNGLSFLLGPLMVPDQFLVKTNDTGYNSEVIIGNYSNPYPTRDEEKQLIWYYMLGMAVISIVILLAMVIYFPDKPKSPPTASSALSNYSRMGFINGIKKLLKNKDVIFSFVGFSLSTGVQGAWPSVMAVNFGILGVGDEQSGYIGLSAVAASIFLGIGVGRFIDVIRKRIKITLISFLVLSTLAYIWLALIVLKVLEFSYIQLFISTLMGSGCITAIMTLFFEYTVEISYPAPEAMVGGLLTLGNNLVGWYIREYFRD